MSTITETKHHPLTEWNGAEIVERYLEWLPEPRTEAQSKAKAAIENNRLEECKVLAACHLEDNYVKAIGYLSSVEKVCAAGLPTLPTLMSEAARAIAEALCDAAIANEDIEDSSRDSSRKIWLADLNEMNRNIFRKALKAADS
ncbi:MAG: hypothetical protein WA947_20660 [Phormidesmis sp.]